MKKILSTVVAILAIILPASLRAQDSTTDYNMVITLQNGTTITLGHNDIKNITFDGREISISGNAANTIDSLRSAVQENTYHIMDVESQTVANYYRLLDQLEYSFNVLNDSLISLKQQIAGNNGSGSSEYDYLNKRVNELVIDVAALNDRLISLEQQIAGNNGSGSSDSNYLDERVKELEAYVTMLNQRVDAGEMITNELIVKLSELNGYTDNMGARLQTKIDEHDVRISLLEDIVKYLQAQTDENKIMLEDSIQKLRTYVDMLQTQIDSIKSQIGM